MKTKIMIVDDSMLSRTIIADYLEEIGYEVVGEAESIEGLIDRYSTVKPDVVTMDIAMPGADGFECSKALLAHDPQARIILVSSMKDDETIEKAKQIGVSGYLQKPVEAEELKRVIDNVMAPDRLFESLITMSIPTFKESLSQNITRMTKVSASLLDEEPQQHFFPSQGISVVIGIIGHYSGTMILDLSESTAEKMAKVLLRREPKNRDEVMALGAEFANIIAGVACSMLNKKEKAFQLRVSPPNVFYGAPTKVISPSLHLQCIGAETPHGRINLFIGFKKGSALWT
ncbi:response regulator [Heliorestis convoluta]|uniref:Stage 0 sporulation protein A homolog n=1 Tax=Heliorestis convoluta TaxID=356322 RepID=A0A5Q2N2F7_9FIRM|nr:response regulator [Heliorestis convoluta]QGG46520.1 Chemotaxis phosphatase CheX [Heliorestis convoluta]